MRCDNCPCRAPAAILKNTDHLPVTSCAPSIGFAGALCASVGLQILDLTRLLSLFDFGVAWGFSRLKRLLPGKKSHSRHEDSASD